MTQTANAPLQLQQPATFPPPIVKDEHKQVLELVRAVLPTIQVRNRMMSRIVVPFFIITVLYFFALFNVYGNVNSPIGFPDPLLGSAEPNSRQSGSGIGILGLVKIYNARETFLYAATITLFAMFIKFGFIYYQALIAARDLQRIINIQAPDDQLNEVLSQVCMENYFTQAVLIFDDTALSNRMKRPYWKFNCVRFFMWLLVAVFLIFTAWATNLTLVFAASRSMFVAYAICAAYIIYYFLLLGSSVVCPFLNEEKAKMRKPQMALFLTIGFVAVLHVVGMFFTLNQPPPAMNPVPFSLDVLHFPYKQGINFFISGRP